MKHSVIVAAMFLAFSGSANATIFGGTTNNDNSVTNQGGHGGHGGQGGDASSIAGASSVAEAKANAAAIAAQQQGQAQGQQQGQNQNAVAAQGQAIVGSGNSGGNTVEGSETQVGVSVGGTTVERSAPAVFNSATSQPLKSCRLTIFGGISRTDGSMSGGIPIGNDMGCLIDQGLGFMERVGTFSAAEKEALICKQELLATTDRCKALSK